MNGDMKLARHIYDYKTLVCSCGRTKEQHLNIDLVAEKWRTNHALGQVNIKQAFEEIDRALKI